MTRRLLTYAEAAEELAISRSSVKRLVARGELAVVEVGPRMRRIRPGDLERFVASCAAIQRSDERAPTGSKLYRGERLWD